MSDVELIPSGPAAASELVAACEEVWRSIQGRHPDVPDVVVVLGTGVERGRLVKLGHWWGGRWVADGQVRGEVLLAGEALHLHPAQVVEVLLHEATHGLNTVRGIKDVSRGGRYHNARFKAAAEELGLVVSAMPPYGWARTVLGSEAAGRYESVTTRLSTAMRIARRLTADPRLGDTGVGQERGAAEGDDQTPEDGRAKAGAVACGCGRRMRMAPSVLARGPVVCGLCDEEFSTEWRPDHRIQLKRTASPHAATIDHRFLDRRREALEAEQTSARHRLLAARAQDEMRLSGLDHLTRLAGAAGGVALLADVCAWREAQRRGDPRAILVTTETELGQANDAARALLKVEGELAGSPIFIAGRELLVGELVVVGEHDTPVLDLDRTELPPAGVLGTVVDIDAAGETFEVDFAIAGRHRLGSGSAAAGLLEYGYAERRAFVGAPLIDLCTIPDLDIAPVADVSAVPELFP